MARNNFKQHLLSFLKTEGVTAFNNKFSAATLASKNFDVQTIVDVGVFQGTPQIYAAFPDSEIILIDPMPGAAKRVGESLLPRTVHVYECGVGNRPEIAQFDIHAAGGKSSLLKRSERFPSTIKETVEVEVRTLDDILRNHTNQSPFGIKIDVEGYELSCLQGARQSISCSSFALIETSIKQRFTDGYRFSDIVRIMSDYEFELLDVLNATGAEPTFFDCLFVPKDSPRLI